MRLDVSGVGYVRFSNYLPQEKVEQHIMRLREYYDVHYYEGILNFETGMFDTQKRDNDEVVRIFPLEKFDTTKTKINMGMIGIIRDSTNFVSEISHNFYTNYRHFHLLKQTETCHVCYYFFKTSK